MPLRDLGFAPARCDAPTVPARRRSCSLRRPSGTHAASPLLVTAPPGRRALPHLRPARALPHPAPALGAAAPALPCRSRVCSSRRSPAVTAVKPCHAVATVAALPSPARRVPAATRRAPDLPYPCPLSACPPPPVASALPASGEHLPYPPLVSTCPTRTARAPALPVCCHACRACLPTEARRSAEPSRPALLSRAALPCCYCCSSCHFYYCTATPAATGGGQMQLQLHPRESLTPQKLREWYISWGCRGGRGGSRLGAGSSGASCSGQVQLQRRPGEILSPQQLHEWYASWGCRSGRGGSRPRAGSSGASCSGQVQLQRRPREILSPQQLQFGDDAELPSWLELLRQRVDIFAIDYDAILTAMYALPTSAEGACYQCVPPDPDIEPTALGAGEAAALGAGASPAPGAGEAAALGASESTAPGAGESALYGTAPAAALHTFTLDSGDSRSFFRDCITLTPLSRPVAVSLADPSGGSVLAHSSTVLPCPAVPTGLHLPSFSTKLVSGADLQDAWVDQCTPGGQQVTHCSCTRTGRHLATFTHQPRSSLHTLTTVSPLVAESGKVSASGQVFAAASRSDPDFETLRGWGQCGTVPPHCSSALRTLLWHHRLGHPSLPRLRCMASRVLVTGLPRSLPPLPLGPAPTCVPCVEGRQRAAPHSSEFPSTEAPLQTLHMDVWGPARVRGEGHERYFLLVVDDYSRYIKVFPLRRKGEVTEVLIDWIRAARHQLGESFGSDLPVLRLHSDRGGEFSSDLLRAFCHAEDIRQTFTLTASPQQNGIAERCIGMTPSPLRVLPPRAGGLAAAGAAGGGGAGGAAGAGAAGGARARGAGAAGASGGPAGAGAAGGAGAGGDAGAGAPRGARVGATGAAGGVAGAGGAARVRADSGGAGAVPAGYGGSVRPRPYFVPLLQQLEPVSPLPAPSPYIGPTGGLTERREPESRPALPVRAARTSRRGSRQRPPPVPGTHQMALRPSTDPQRVPLPSPPVSSLSALADPESDSLRAASPTVTRLLATVVTDPSFESTAVSALVVELVDFAAHYRLDYAASLVAEFESVCPPSVGGECALSTDVLEDRQEEFQCFAADLPHLVSMLLAPEGDPDAPDIPTPRSYAEAIEGPYSSQWQTAMDAEMASWKSTGTYVDEVPPPGANIVDGMWIFRVKRPPGSPPVFKARYVARGLSQRQGVDYFQTFSSTPKMTTLRVLLQVATQRDYELHSLDFSTAFLQGSLHEEIWLRRPPGFTGSFPPGTQWSLRRPVYGLRQAPHEWHDTLRTTLAALGFAPSTADPSLFIRTDTTLLPFYILVYVDDLVFATAYTAGLAHVKSELQKRHTCTDLCELRSYLGLQITRDRARRTITLTQSRMVQQVLQRFNFTYSSPQATPVYSPLALSSAFK
ncbi:unnamed protein product [Closterium sp. NIES-53]